MKTVILGLISANNYQSFSFQSGHNDPISHLRTVTRNVPNESGMYFVFAPKDSKRNTPPHVEFGIKGRDYELVYFGKAGGATTKGKNTRQKLNGRINNVVGTPSIKRAIYWNVVMSKKIIPYFEVFYCYLDQPQAVEELIYSYLKSNKLDYPMLNGKRGRPPGKQNQVSAK